MGPKTPPRAVRSPPCRTFPPVSPSADHRSLQWARAPGRSLDGFGTPPSRSGVETTVDPFHVLPESPADHRHQRRRGARRPRCHSGARLTGPRPGEGASLAAVRGGPIPPLNGWPALPVALGTVVTGMFPVLRGAPAPGCRCLVTGGVTGMASGLFVLGPPTAGTVSLANALGRPAISFGVGIPVHTPPARSRGARHRAVAVRVTAPAGNCNCKKQIKITIFL
jgi:hypothetical protein